MTNPPPPEATNLAPALPVSILDLDLILDLVAPSDDDDAQAAGHAAPAASTVNTIEPA